MTAMWALMPNPKTPSVGVAGEEPPARRAPQNQEPPVTDPRFSFFGVPIPTEDLARELADQLVVRDEEYRTLTTRLRTENVVPVGNRCLCSHAKSQHGRGEKQCYMAACGCGSFRVKA